MSTAYTRARIFMFGCCMFLGLPAWASTPLPVVASFSILADMVREIGGPYVEVTALVGPNSDAHVFDPTPADARRLASARLVIVNGLGFEGWLDRLVQSSGYRGPIVIASKSVKTPLTLKNAKGKPIDSHGHFHGTSDPHAWQNLEFAKHYVLAIQQALDVAMPEHSLVFAQRATDYIKRIDQLEHSTKSRIAAVAPERRQVISSHDAFGYFAQAYGIKFYSLQGISTGSEPSAAVVARTIDQIRKNNVTAIFAENISDSRVLDRIAKDSGARIGGTLYADALSEPGTPADTYLKMFELNVDTLIAGISASLPKTARSD